MFLEYMHNETEMNGTMKVIISMSYYCMSYELSLICNNIGDKKNGKCAIC